MNDTIQYDTPQSKGHFIPEQKTDYIFTTTSIEGDFYTALITEALFVSFTIINFVFLIIVWRKLKRIEKKLS